MSQGEIKIFLQKGEFHNKYLNITNDRKLINKIVVLLGSVKKWGKRKKELWVLGNVCEDKSVDKYVDKCIKKMKVTKMFL